MARSKSRQTGPVYFTTFQVAKLLGVSPPTVVNWANSGLLAVHFTPGGHRRIRKEDIVAFAREQQYPLSLDANGAVPGGSRRLLVVDDDKDFSAMVRDYMVLKGAFEVEVADSGFSAGLTVARFKPHVILMDIEMPEMNGFDVLRMLQDDPEMRAIPVMACTAYRYPHVEERVRREAFVGYLEKPLRLERLIDVLHAAVSGRPGAFHRA